MPMEDHVFSELATLFFSTKQIMRKQMPNNGHIDPNAWLRFETMRFIGESKEPSMQELAEYLRIQAPSATSLVSHLVEAGFVERKSEAGDKRIVRVVLTPIGKKEVADYMARSVVTMRKTFSQLGEREVETLLDILRHLRDAHAKESK